MSAEEQRKLAAIMFTDMVGYSALSQRDDKLAQELLEEHRQLLREIFPRFHGTEIKTIGDAFMVEFNSALEAAQCAIEIQRALAKRNADAPAERQIEIRIGIHIGDVVHRGGDVYGDGVNIASRIEQLANAGGICVSMDVERQIRNAVETRFEKLAPTELKNISVPMELFRIVLPWERQGTPVAKIQAQSKSTSRKFLPTAIAIVLLLIIGIRWWWTTHKPVTAGGQPVSRASDQLSKIPEKSIAVLPFENLSHDPDNAYFATGIQDEILTRLAKIGALKVISRTSTQQYAARPGNLSEIARQLNVANILEGSVQRAGDQVHINAQLVRAATDEHLWAESYDRKLENIFGVEAEVATAVAEALKAKLTGTEQQALEQRPTNNPGAYDAYLRGLALSVHLSWSEKDVLAAIKSFREAVTLDAGFVLAWAGLAHQSALAYFNQFGADFQALGEESKRAADKAIALQPDLVESHLAQGYWHYYGERDFDGAIGWFEKARSISPKNSETIEALALVYRRKGQWERSLEYFRQAMEIDPRNVALLSAAGDTFYEQRQYPEAVKIYDRLLEMIPGEPHALANKIGISQDGGDLAAAAALLAPLHPATTSELFQAQIDQWIYERRYANAIGALSNALEKPDPTATDWDKIQIEARLAWLQQISGDISTARGTWDDVRSKLEQLRRSKRKDFGVWELASAYVALGDKDKAFAVVKEGDAVVPASKDAMAAAFFPNLMARIAIQAGEKDLALQQLETLAHITRNGLSYGSLKFNPEWDPLRGDPRFEKIVQSLAPKESK